jgi:hypothetical protein
MAACASRDSTRRLATLVSHVTSARCRPQAAGAHATDSGAGHERARPCCAAASESKCSTPEADREEAVGDELSSGLSATQKFLIDLHGFLVGTCVSPSTCSDAM